MPQTQLPQLAVSFLVTHSVPREVAPGHGEGHKVSVSWAQSPFLSSGLNGPQTEMGSNASLRRKEAKVRHFHLLRLRLTRWALGGVTRFKGRLSSLLPLPIQKAFLI